MIFYFHRKLDERQYKNKYIKLELPEEEQYRCYYCGMNATQTDHVPPISHGGDFNLGFLIHSCSECNIILGDNRYETLNERSRTIKLYLQKKFKKTLKYPDWSDEEIEEMSGRLKEAIVNLERAKRIIKERINYSSSMHEIYKNIKLYYIESYNKYKIK